MPRALHVLFDQHRRIAEAVRRFALARCERGSEVLCLLDDAHALAAAARAGFDQNGIADAVGFRLQQRRVLVRAVIAGHQRHAGALHQLLRFGFQPHRADRVRRRADEDHAGVCAGGGERVVFAQETVARMHRLRAGVGRRLQDALPAQITVLGRAAADVHRFVADRHVLGMRVRVGVNRHGLDAEPACGGCHAAGDLAAVGDQYFFKHGCDSAARLLACAARTSRSGCAAGRRGWQSVSC